MAPIAGLRPALPRVQATPTTRVQMTITTGKSGTGCAKRSVTRLNATMMEAITAWVALATRMLKNLSRMSITAQHTTSTGTATATPSSIPLPVTGTVVTARPRPVKLAPTSAATRWTPTALCEERRGAKRRAENGGYSLPSGVVSLQSQTQVALPWDFLPPTIMTYGRVYHYIYYCFEDKKNDCAYSSSSTTVQSSST